MRGHDDRYPGVLLIQTGRLPRSTGLFVRNATMHVDTRTPAFPASLFRITIHSLCAGTLRGLHYQEPHAQGKLVMVTEGAVYDVVVDIRKGSPSFGRWYGVRALGGEPAPSLCAARLCAWILRDQRPRLVPV
mgnify:CR=1 FL=1